MDLRHWLDLAGGIGLFLYGMQLMTNGLESIAAGPLRSALGRAVCTLPRAILTGTLITALVQSSSAVSLLVIALTGSGLLPLTGAAGIILGANIGTTATGQLLALGSFGAGPALWAPFFCLLGALLNLFCPQKPIGKAGRVLLGFGLLFSGLDGVRAAAAPLGRSPRFSALLAADLGPLRGFFLGALSSVMLQSSSAAVGLLQALAGAGLLQAGAAVPLILGQNLGACLTPLAAARATGGTAGVCCARFHLLFNAFAGTLGLFLWQCASALGLIRPGAAVSGAGVAAIHTLFNLSAVLLLAPFTPLLLRICGHFRPGQ